jgi:biotin-dependent carboxylase-like uncharacterized protein
MSVTVLKPGLLSTVQDRGRRGYAALGVGVAGPMDEVAFRLANALAGNGEDAAALEITLIGPRLRFDTAATIALIGAEFTAQIDATPIAGWRAIEIGAGSVLDCGRARRGARGYLAIAGGFAVEHVLGSAATDVNAGLGPFGGRTLREGDALHVHVGAPEGAMLLRSTRKASRLPALPPGAGPTAWSLDPRSWFDPDLDRPIRLVRGSHFTALDRTSREALFAAHFRIATDSNRVGFRLDGPRLAFAEPLELVSEPVGFGTLQLPPGGQPIALTVEHPTTGGYPRIGQIAAIDLPRLAQRRPGDPVRFIEIGLDEAQTRYLRRERELARLVEAIATRLRTGS